MEFWKRHNTTDTTDFYPRQLVTDLLLRNWCMDLALRKQKMFSVIAENVCEVNVLKYPKLKLKRVLYRERA